MTVPSRMNSGPANQFSDQIIWIVLRQITNVKTNIVTPTADLRITTVYFSCEQPLIVMFTGYEVLTMFVSVVRIMAMK